MFSLKAKAPTLRRGFYLFTDGCKPSGYFNGSAGTKAPTEELQCTNTILRQLSKIKIIFCFAKPGKNSPSLNAKREQGSHLPITDAEPLALRTESSRSFVGAIGTVLAARGAWFSRLFLDERNKNPRSYRGGRRTFRRSPHRSWPMDCLLPGTSRPNTIALNCGGTRRQSACSLLGRMRSQDGP
jgi:hypothetical protein